ncbi:PKD domain-containing protein [Piscinibacter defluvii]|uniref:PKD domain-containing protein n=1 Tax=Piscinibacter defluvii TaxID=1796922 RepID=UPI0013E3A863|nr:PKD domain-containing protein [Piscinibacter defluvii]
MSLSPSPLRPHLAALFAAAALLGCGGGGGGNPPAPPPPPPPANTEPEARFSAAATVAAGAPLALDARASSDADGDTLVHHWDFGDGTRGGGARLAHVYPAAGDYTVRLTVDDGRGGRASVTRSVTVTAGPAPGTPAPATVLVSDADGVLAGVTVALLGSNTTARTAADGKATLQLPTGAERTLKFSKPGYADQFKVLQLPGGANGTQVEVRLHPRDAALTLADATAGGTLAGRDGARLVLPPGALVDAAGNPVTGPVQVAVTPVDPAADPRAFPGRFQGLRPAGTRGLIESYGTVEFVPTRNGAPLQLAPGRQATIEIPIYTGLHREGRPVQVGDTIPLWSLDERSGDWVQEGQGTVVASTASPSELALRARVGHLSWWNCDQWLGAIPEDSWNPNLKCCIRDTANGPCKENSGDICEHTGSGGSGSSGAGAAGPLGTPRHKVRLAVEPATRRAPAVAAFATAPAVAGARLPMPAGVDITLDSTARNGTYRGRTVLRGAAGVLEDVTVSVLPVAGGGDGEAITLPWQQDYAVQANGELDRYTLQMPAGPGFELYVSRSGSNLTGTLTLRRPDGSVAGRQNFAAGAAYLAEASVAAAGTYTIEISAGSNAPGAYRLEAVSFGACSSIAVASVPGELQVELAPKQSRCFDLALPADSALQVELTGNQNQLAGSIALASAGGAQQLVARPYPGLDLLTGVSAAGTYRLRVSNTTLNTGRVDLALARPAAEVIGVPATRTITDLVQGEPRLYLVKPPATGPNAGLYHVMLSATSVQAGVQVDPANATIVTGCASCTNPIAQTTALAQRNTAPGLPVLSVFRNAGTANPGTVVLRTGVPTLITRDADVSGSTGELPSVYAFDAEAGDAIAWALAQPAAANGTAGLSVLAPSGATVTSASPVRTLAESGPHTALVDPSPSGGSGQPFTLRVNSAPPVQALALTPPLTQRSVTLPLGQVLRYSLDLEAADLVGLELASPGPLAVLADIPGVVAESTTNSGSGPIDLRGAPGYVRVGGPTLLTLRTNSNVLERARGSLTFGVRRPAPPTVAMNATRSGTLAPFGWTSFRVDVPAAGRYLLRLAATTPAPYALTGTVWAPSTIFSNYGGEFTASLSSASVPVEGLGPLAAGVHTISVRHPGGNTSDVGFAAALVDLEAPVALAVNGATVAGTLDAGERDYASFAGTGGQAYTLVVTPQFAGTLRVRKLNPNGDWTNRTDVFTLAGMPVALASGSPATVNFTIPADATFGSGSYVVELAGEGTASGAWTMQIDSP